MAIKRKGFTLIELLGYSDHCFAFGDIDALSEEGKRGHNAYKMPVAVFNKD